jgi:hypothetical protein
MVGREDVCYVESLAPLGVMEVGSEGSMEITKLR